MKTKKKKKEKDLKKEKRKKRKKNQTKRKKKEEKEKPRGAVVAMVGDRPHRHEGLKRKAEVSSRRQDLPQAPRVQVPGRTNQKWRKAIQTARCFRANKGRHMDSLKDFKRAYYANSSTHGQQDLGQLGREGVARVLVGTCT